MSYQAVTCGQTETAEAIALMQVILQMKSKYGVPKEEVIELYKECHELLRNYPEAPGITVA